PEESPPRASARLPASRLHPAPPAAIEFVWRSAPAAPTVIARSPAADHLPGQRPRPAPPAPVAAVVPPGRLAAHAPAPTAPGDCLSTPPLLYTRDPHHSEYTPRAPLRGPHCARRAGANRLCAAALAGERAAGPPAAAPHSAATLPDAPAAPDTASGRP